MTSSRTEAPLAQCDPRLIGESQLGSWPIHTPLETSAVTVQPTAQCVQMPLWMVTAAPWRGRRTSLGLTHTGERKGAERGQTAGGETGAVQECSAIDAGPGLIGERNTEMAAACLTFCFLDQHGYLP